MLEIEEMNRSISGRGFPRSFLDKFSCIAKNPRILLASAPFFSSHTLFLPFHGERNNSNIQSKAHYFRVHGIDQFFMGTNIFVFLSLIF